MIRIFIIVLVGSVFLFSKPIAAQEKIQINVRELGAKGDGLTNDIKAVQNAIDQAASREINTIYFPPGTYLLDETEDTPFLRIYKSGVKVCGENAYLVRKSRYKQIFQIGSDKNGHVDVQNITFENLNFQGNASNLVPKEDPAIAIAISSNSDYSETRGNCRNIHISNCNFKNFNMAITSTGVSNLTISGCKFYDNVYIDKLSAGGYGVLVQTGNNITIENCLFRGSEGDRHAVYIASDRRRQGKAQNSNVVIKNNQMYWESVTMKTNFEVPIVVRSTNSCVISSNLIRGGMGQITFEAKGYGNGSAIVIENNQLLNFLNTPKYQVSSIKFNYDKEFGWDNVKITKNFITSTCPINGIVASSIKNLKIIGNFISIKGVENSGVEVIGVDNAQIELNSINGGGQEGVSVNKHFSSQSVSIRRNIIRK